MARVQGEFKSTKKLEKIPLPDSGKDLWKDAGTSGLYLTLSASGKRAWEVQLKYKGKPIWKTIGYYHEDGMGLGEARAKVKEARERIKAKLEPFPDLSDKRFPALWEKFVDAELQNHKKRSREVFETLRRRIGESWDDKLVTEVTTEDCADLMDDVGRIARASTKAKAGGKGAENNAYASLKRFYDWCWRRKYLDESPMSRLTAPHKQIVRDRVLTPKEFVEIWHAIGEEKYPFRQIGRFAMLVPERIWSEVAMIRRDQVKEGAWSYNVPKTGRKQVLPLPDGALELLEECPNLGKYYFGKVPLNQNAKTDLKKRIAARLDIDDWVFHDFRTAFTTHLREYGVPRDLADQIQRPVKGKTAGDKHYDMSIRPREKGEVLDYWSYLMNRWLEGRLDEETNLRWREYITPAPVVKMDRSA